MAISCGGRFDDGKPKRMQIPTRQPQFLQHKKVLDEANIWRILATAKRANPTLFNKIVRKIAH